MTESRVQRNPLNAAIASAVVCLILGLLLSWIALRVGLISRIGWFAPMTLPAMVGVLVYFDVRSRSHSVPPNGEL